MTMLLHYWPHLLAFALVFGAGYWVGKAVWEPRLMAAEAALVVSERDVAYRVAEAEARARRVEQRRIESIAEIEAKHAREMGRIEREAETLVSDLRTGTVRLRKHWKAAVATCDVSRDSAAALEAERAAELRAESAARIVRIGAEADSRVRALVEAYESVRDIRQSQ